MDTIRLYDFNLDKFVIIQRKIDSESRLYPRISYRGVKLRCCRPPHKDMCDWWAEDFLF